MRRTIIGRGKYTRSREERTCMAVKFTWLAQLTENTPEYLSRLLSESAWQFSFKRKKRCLSLTDRSRFFPGQK
jgi:hypothetical protein